MSIAVVSGGTGYVGRFIVEGLLKAGYKVVVLGRRPPAEGFFSAPVTFAPLDLDSGKVAPDTFVSAASFVHAAFDHVPGRYRGGEGDDPAAFRRRNLDGSVVLFEAARAAGVRRTVFLSSRAAYGTRTAGVWLDEADKALPDTLYGEVKLEAENALRQMRDEGFRGISLRVTGVYGPGGPGRAHKWAGLFADYLAGKPSTPRAGTEVHGDDVAEAVRIALEHSAPHDLLNVSDIVIDQHDLLGMVKELTGSPRPLPARADAAAINSMRTDRLRALGWVPGGEALLRRTVAQLLQTSATSL